MDSYTWELTASNNEFFNGLYKSYEVSSGYSEDELVELRNKYINGNTAVFREIVKLINGKRETIKVLNINYDWYHEIKLIDNCVVLIILHPNGIDEFHSIGELKTVEDIRELIDSITDSWLPINPLKLIN